MEINFGFVHIWRRELWTSICYDIDWRMQFGWEPKSPWNGDEFLPGDEDKKKRVLFLRQNPYFNFAKRRKWALMRRDIPEKDDPDVKKLDEWLEKNYQGIKFPDRPESRSFQRSTLIWGICIQLVTTVILGGLTRFRVGIRSHAVWLLIWMYGRPVLRWRVLLNAWKPLDQACLSLWPWFLSGIFNVLGMVLQVAAFGALTVLCVELFGIICHKEFSLAPRLWFLIGFLIFVAFVLVIIVLNSVVLYSKSLCILLLTLENRKAKKSRIAKEKEIYGKWKRTKPKK